MVFVIGIRDGDIYGLTFRASLYPDGDVQDV